MPLIWGWGPFAIKPTGEEFPAAERVREAVRNHRDTPVDSDDFLSSCQAMTSAVHDLWTSATKRMCLVEGQEGLDIPKGGDDVELLPSPPGTIVIEKKQVSLIRNLLEASLVASLVGIEYELKGARLQPATFPATVSGLACWEVSGQARDTATDRSTPGFGWSHRFNPANRNAVDAEFLVAAARAYVDAVHGILPFLRRNGARDDEAGSGE